MKACDFLNKLHQMDIQVIAGVPDSTLKQFCDGLQLHGEKFKHYVTANEGAAVGVATGAYLASGKPACVYMQNSGIGNIINPLASIANEEVYGIPMLFIVGWRGEPGVKDEPQHVFQGKVTCELFEVMQVPYAVIDKETTEAELDTILEKAAESFSQSRQYTIIVKKGTFEKEDEFTWKNGNQLIREDVLAQWIRKIPRDAYVVSTTGKISRELYEQSNAIYGDHKNIFMTVGGMGHASMIAFGLASQRPEKKVYCIDGDGAALMHMGALAFIASQAPKNFVHVIINNRAHESVGAMPTGCGQTSFAKIAEAAGYQHAVKISTMGELEAVQKEVKNLDGPVLIEIMVALDSRADLGRPKESARENREAFMEYHGI